MSYLGLDIGTGSCKAVVFDFEGRELASASREYEVLHPYPDQAELNPGEVMEKCFEVIREVNSITDDPVSSMSISSQGEAFTPLSSNGEILGNAMVSSDSRAAALSSQWSSEFGREKIYQITGHTPHPLFTLYKLLWIKENQREVWSKAGQFLCFEDLFQFMVGLKPRISWPMAGRTMLFDVRNHCWSEEILSAIELDPGKLAEPIASGMKAGYIDLKTAKDLGFKDKVLVVSGGHDQTCAALGAGITKPGLCMYATGSVECFCPILKESSLSSELMEHNLCCYDYTVAGYYTTVAYSLTGGNILRWVRDQFGQEEMKRSAETGQNAYALLLESMPDNPTELHVLPYFSASGTPYFDTETRGAIIGLRQTTTKGEIIKALLEGVALEMKLNLELMEASGMKVDTFIATGGGTKNDNWTQMKADILNRKVIVRDVQEAGCYGAALLACSAETNIPVDKITRRKSGGDKIFQPDEERVQTYGKKLRNYKRIYAVMKKLYHNPK